MPVALARERVLRLPVWAWAAVAVAGVVFAVWWPVHQAAYPALGTGDLDCDRIGHQVRVDGADPYRLDADGDGTGCEAERSTQLGWGLAGYAVAVLSIGAIGVAEVRRRTRHAGAKAHIEELERDLGVGRGD